MTTKTEGAGKATGRPRKYATDVQRQVVAFRVNSNLHADMLKGAKEADLTLSEFTEEAVKYYIEYGPQTVGKSNAALGNLVSSMSRSIEREVGFSWIGGNLSASYFFRRLFMVVQTFMGATNDTSSMIEDDGLGGNLLSRSLGLVRSSEEIKQIRDVLRTATQDELRLLDRFTAWRSTETASSEAEPAVGSAIPEEVTTPPDPIAPSPPAPARRKRAKADAKA